MSIDRDSADSFLKDFDKQQAIFKAEMAKKDVPYKVRQVYNSHLMHGASIDVDSKYLNKISSIPMVKSVWPILSICIINDKDHLHSQLVEFDGKPNLNITHKDTGVSKLHEVYGLSGKGIKVAIIDSGVDYTHASLGGCFGKGCKVESGLNYVGGGSKNRAKALATPYDDCVGHGTHVSGIVAARDKDFVGVAPDSKLSVYRIFGCGKKSQVDYDVVITALLQAFRDKSDVINMSFGGTSNWSQYLDSKISSAISQYGVIVVAAFGNEGEFGLWTGGSPSMGDDVIAVGSTDSSQFFARAFILHGEKDVTIEMGKSSTNQKFDLDNAGIVLGEDIRNKLGCTPITDSSVKGKILFVQRGECTFQDKIENAQKAGADGVVIYNNKAGHAKMMLKKQSLKIPAVMISKNDWLKIKEQAKSGKSLKLSTTKNNIKFVPETGGKVSQYSSIGPGPVLESKPDVVTPGGKIYSTYPMKKGGYTMISGTSMAAPYLSGVAALWLEYQNKENAKKGESKNYAMKFKDVVKACSRPVLHVDENEKVTDQFASVPVQGSGLLDAECLITNKVDVFPTQIKLGDLKQGKEYKGSLTVKNNSENSVRYKIEHVPVQAITEHDKDGKYNGKVSYGKAEAKVEFDNSEITLAPGETKDISYTLTSPTTSANGKFWLFSGYFLLKVPKDSDSKVKNDLTVTYLGMADDYSQMRVMPGGADKNAPFLTSNTLIKEYLKSANVGKPVIQNVRDKLIAKDLSFNLAKGEHPIVSLKLHHPTMLLTAELVDANTNKTVSFIHPKGISTLVGRSLGGDDNNPFASKRSMYMFEFIGIGLRLAEVSSFMKRIGSAGKSGKFEQIAAPDYDPVSAKIMGLNDASVYSNSYMLKDTNQAQEFKGVQSGYSAFSMVNIKRDIMGLLRKLAGVGQPKFVTSTSLGEIMYKNTMKNDIYPKNTLDDVKPRMDKEDSDDISFRPLVGKISPGSYYIKLKALKPIGRYSEGPTFDYWSSPSFSISYNAVGLV
ncbi:Minor extracellular protease vpr [Zancudomyces culisetae]|uniref:Minor extracellular protease vpr n=1 Tax=Zancudomyces culisetae TaxID=1213189 RepID=A0A1R1PQ97_ZANCU|nr:Minor extracellular protease vpr [Zancudomyces culisetae]|eukprot:OMH83083.1 Minor extracellular protease vpr [Zancudomyces culisetae]